MLRDQGRLDFRFSNIGASMSTYIILGEFLILIIV